jgi:hypothetical protein
MTNPVPAPRRPRPTAGELLHEIRCLITDLPRFATAPFYRRRHLRWGATDDEVRASMPGDEVITNPKYLATRAITIEAPPSAVRPWLAQVGCLRAGLRPRPARQSRSPELLDDPAGIPTARDRPVGTDVTHTLGDHGVQSRRLRGGPMVAVEATTEHMVLGAHADRRRQHPARHPVAYRRGLAPSPHLDFDHGAQRVR